MKHRWALCWLLSVARAVAACTPAEREAGVPSGSAPADVYDDY